MKDEQDWEWYYYETNPSPLDGVVIWCKTPFCKLVLDYHGTQWRRATDEDSRVYREKGGYTFYCPKHLAQAQKEKQDEEE